MTSRGLLPDDVLRELHAAVVSAGIARDDLIERLDRRLVAGFRNTSSSGGQVWVDLATLNDIHALADGSVPLHTWLRTAHHLAGPRAEGAVFAKALAALGVAAESTSKGTPVADVPKPSPASTADTSAPDILVVTVLPEEYAAVLRLLSNARAVQGSADSPTLYGWRTGTIPRSAGGAYRTVLALAGRAGNVNASQAVIRSVERWKPRYVLLVGIAGGFPREGCVPGDVVVSTELYGYEYGKIDGGFQPRPNWIYQVDRGLCAGAQAFAAANPGWWSGASPSPKVLFGPVASGDKVVDDPSEPFFAAVLRQWSKLQAIEMEGVGAAAAIDELHAAGVQVGFLMVRGISDVPRPPSERGAGAQTEERDANKRRACEVAAAFAVRWIAEEWPVLPREFEPGPAV